MIAVLDQEQTVGLETFFTNHEGIGGKLRNTPDDFIVTELFSPPEETSDGMFTIATIQSRNWETNHLIRTLSKQLHISRKRIHFAGTKDKRSVSTQLFSFYDVGTSHVESLKLRDVTITNVYRSDTKLYLGALKGNHFDICIRQINETVDANQIEAILGPIQHSGGFPNFFGIQRFGIIRPITHLVGKHLVQGDVEAAVMTYLTSLDPHEDRDIYDQRKQLKETNDFSYAFHHFSPTLSYEKAMLNHLQVHPTDFLGALQELPKNLISLFINAYQSYLFNQMLSRRIQKNLPLHQALVGDVIIEIEKGTPTENYFLVSEKNRERINTQIKRGKAMVCSVLVGYETEFSKGEMGEIEEKVFEKEDIDKRDFIIPDLAMASSKGSRRALLAPLRKMSFDLHPSKDKNEPYVSFQFDLNKGCYATSFLREVMKASDIRDY